MTNFFLRQPHHRGGIRQETVVIPEKMCYNPENAVQAQGGSVMPTLVPILADIRSGAEEAPPVPNTTFGMLFACWAAWLRLQVRSRRRGLRITANGMCRRS